MNMRQRVVQLSQEPALEDLWRYLDEVINNVVAEAVVIQQIPAPTFHEVVRANHVLSRLGACGLVDTGIDSIYNAYGRLPGTDPEAPAVLVSAHTDTVFPADTDLTIRHAEDGHIYGPGLGDNSLGVAALIALADLLRQFAVRPRRDIWFVATSREEGLGNMDGMRAFCDRLTSRQLGVGIVLEGMAFGRIYHVGIPVRRLKITCRGEGGHSWQNFGRPNAIHTLVRLGARLTGLTPPAEPRTTFNIGLIEGGHSVNSLATEASFYLDLRSESTDTLAALEAQVLEIIEQARQSEDVSIETSLVGDRPGGFISPDHELIGAAAAALELFGVEPTYARGSTDANYPLSIGLPAVTIGVATGDNAHRLDEYVDTTPLMQGVKQLVLLTLAAAEWTVGSGRQSAAGDRPSAVGDQPPGAGDPQPVIGDQDLSGSSLPTAAG